MSYDPRLIPDVADALGISAPAIVEKCYFAAELLKLLRPLDIESHRLAFAGGTSLAKAYRSTYRMSEDVDIKLVPQQELSGLSNHQKRLARKSVVEAILERLDAHADLSLVEGGKTVRNEYVYTELRIEHPQRHPVSTALRPHLKLDLTESALLEEPVTRLIQSLYAEVLNQDAEVSAFACVTATSTASEKLVALLRRTAHAARMTDADDDETLIRHVYDLHLVHDLISLADFRRLVAGVIEHDVARFGNRHTEFVTSPRAELLFGLTCLCDNPIHPERYGRFLGPLVYHDSPADWETALASVTALADAALSDHE